MNDPQEETECGNCQDCTEYSEDLVLWDQDQICLSCYDARIDFMLEAA